MRAPSLTRLAAPASRASNDDNAASGDIEVEEGAAFLVSLNNERTKGNKVSAEIELNFDGLPTTALAA